MVGFWLTTLVSFAIVRRRSNAVAGLIAMLLLALSGTFGSAYEARGYGVMLGLFALALLAWSEAARGHHRSLYLPMLGFTLAAGIWTHYYAALSILPILAGEVVRLGQRRKPDWGVLASLIGAGVTILPLYPLARMALAESATYWRHARFADLWEAYTSIMGAVFSPWALALIVCMGAISFTFFCWKSSTRREWIRIPAHEAVAAVATLLIPTLAVLIGVFVTGFFVPRYALSAVVGFAMIVPVVTWKLGPKNGVVEMLVCVVLLTSFGYVARDVRPSQSLAFESPLEARPLFVAALSRSKPVVVTGTLFLQLWYYVPPENRRWLFYIADPTAALKFLGTDSLDRDYLTLRDWYPVGIQDYSTFVAAHPKFQLYAVEALTWLPAKLREDGLNVREIGAESWAILYEVCVR
jgi:hypothetical protein